MARKRKTQDDTVTDPTEESVITEAEASATTDEAEAGEAEVAEVVEAETIDSAQDSATNEPETAERERAVDEAPPPALVPEQRRGGWFLPFLAGLATALVGFLLAFTQLNTGWPFKNAAMEAVSEQQAEQTQSIDGLRTEVSALDAKLSGLATQDSVTAQAAQLEAAQVSIKTLQDSQAGLIGQIDELRRRPPEVSGDTLSQEAVAAYERELKAMREHFDAELERIRAASQSAAEAQAQAAEVGLDARITMALGSIRTALDSGGAFSEQLKTLTELDPNNSVAELTPFSAGVPTLPVLQSEFPAFARTALSATNKAQTADSTNGKFSSFLRSQLGVRSLSPKDGDSADAILSRVESSLHGGDLASALQELSGLPEPALTEMAPWIEKATTRQNSISAFEEFSKRATQG